MHTYVQAKGDETREYTFIPKPKLHAAVGVVKQVTNPFSISHVTDVG